MFRPIRTLISLAFLGVLVWCSFNVRLGSRTFAEHADRIGQTHEAKALLDGTRSTLAPAIEGATERLLGEYIEAPTTDGRSPATRTRAPVPPRPSSRIPRADERASGPIYATRADDPAPPLPGE